MKKSEKAVPNQLLRKARKQSYWTQSQVAEKLGTTVVNVNRWESGTTTPSLYFRQKLCELFGKTPEEMGLLPESERQEQAAASVIAPAFWNVPFRRNPYFTGRQEVFSRLETVLTGGNVAALAQPQAISGLGGVGKTQAAVEYAYRHRDIYQAVLWVKADSLELLTSDFVELSRLLGLPEKDEQDQYRAVAGVKRWLKDYTDWLLILDNVENLEQVSDFLPGQSSGHVLLTTRTQNLGPFAQRIELDKLTEEEGALLLLRRAKVLAPDASLEFAPPVLRTKALELTQLLDGLPLALDQAAAYIEETECGLSGYLERFRTRRARLLTLRGSSGYDHPESVATTWSLSFENVEMNSQAAADMLCLCAFLHPEAIPEEIFSNVTSEYFPALGSVANDPLELDSAIRELRKYSLIRRDPETHLLQIHRLVQAVLKDGMEEHTQRQWAELTVCIVNRIFPKVELKNRSDCERYLPHALACSDLIKNWKIQSTDAASLLQSIGDYLQERAQYIEAEPLYQLSLTIREQKFGQVHSDVADSLSRLGILYWKKGQYERVEPLYLRSLAIREKLFDIQHHSVAQNLHDLALLYFDQGKYEQVEQLLLRALAIFELQDGSNHPDLATCLKSIARLYDAQAKYEKAEVYYLRALAIYEKLGETEHQGFVICLNDLALHYWIQKKYTQAEALYERVITFNERIYGLNHPDAASSLNNLALIYYDQAKYEQAEPLYLQTIVIWEQTLGTDHPHFASGLNNLAALYRVQGKYKQAEPLYLRALAIRERILGPEHIQVAYSLNGLAMLYSNQERYEQAEAFYQRALKIREHVLGSEHPDVALVLEKYADLLRTTNRENEALELEARAKAIRAR